MMEQQRLWKIIAQHPRPILHGRWNESVQSERSGSHWKSQKGQFRKYLHRRYQHLHDRGGQTGRIRCTNSFDAVTRLPGISVTNGNEIHIRNNPEQPVIVVDDVCMKTITTS